jgi:hypothetical protein
MTQFIRPTMPSVLRRAFDAFAANDPVSIGEAFEPFGTLVTHIDSQLLRMLGLEDTGKAIRSNGNLAITQQFAAELSIYRVGHMELTSAIRAGREVAVVCDFEAKLVSTGDSVATRCIGIYTLNERGQRLVSARSVCQLITPGWDHKFN